MNQPQSNNSKARVAWGGDRYFISDGKSTDYYIQLQKQKVTMETRQKRFGSTIEKNQPSNKNNTPESILRQIGERNAAVNKLKKPIIQQLPKQQKHNQKSFHANQSNTKQNKQQTIMPLVVQKSMRNNKQKQQNLRKPYQTKLNNRSIIKPTAELSQFRRGR